MSGIKILHSEIKENGVYAVCEVCALLKCGESALRECIKEKQLISFRIGNGKKRPHIRIKGADLLDFINKRRNEA